MLSVSDSAAERKRVAPDHRLAGRMAGIERGVRRDTFLRHGGQAPAGRASGRRISDAAQRRHPAIVTLIAWLRANSRWQFGYPD